MCRSINPLFNYEPAATPDDVRAASLQFVRKISGYRTPGRANAEAFERAVDEITAAAERLLADLHTAQPPKHRDPAHEHKQTAASS